MSSFAEVPKQGNSRDENKQIKNGETPEVRKKQPNKLRQKDRDVPTSRERRRTR